MIVQSGFVFVAQAYNFLGDWSDFQIFKEFGISHISRYVYYDPEHDRWQSFEFNDVNISCHAFK